MGRRVDGSVDGANGGKVASFDSFNWLGRGEVLLHLHLLFFSASAISPNAYRPFMPPYSPLLQAHRDVSQVRRLGEESPTVLSTSVTSLLLGSDTQTAQVSHCKRTVVSKCSHKIDK